MHKSILLITNESSSNLGTGFVIDKDSKGVFVATCGHVVNGHNNSILVEGKKAEILKNEYSNGLDLAILYVDGLDMMPLSISDEKSAESVQVIGYSRLSGVPKREPINDVRIKYNIKFSGDKEINAIKLYPDESISSGYSGSPVICQTSKKVIGVVNIQVGDDTNYAIAAEHLHEVYDIPNSSGTAVMQSSQEKRGLVTEIEKEDIILIKEQFNVNLNNALQSFSSQRVIWVEPRLHTKEADINLSTDKDTKVNIDDIRITSKSLVIRGRPQFGLTCLAHYLVKEAWENVDPSLWLYLDCNDLKPHAKEIKKHVAKKLKALKLSTEDIACIVLDEFSTNINDAEKIIELLCEEFEEIPIVVMMTHVENPLINKSIKFPKNREFDRLHLWALPKNDVRKVVSKYNDGKYIGNENAVVDKVVTDLDVINIPRTALNCLTILKIYEVEFDDSPVNRTEMIRRVLFLLFNVDDIPRYKNRPDIKDTEYILGYFCELIIKDEKCYFTRDEFLKTLNNFCNINEIDLDINVIFDILYANNIIILRGQQFCFKFNYWVFYFAAHRMHHNHDFANYVLQDMRYISYPELMEFYTGIDRRRNDALNVLLIDLKFTRKVVEDKCGLPHDFNLYSTARWAPNEKCITEMHNEISNGVLNSNLPDIVKDQYADKTYNRTRPFAQSIHTILEDYSLVRLMRNIRAGSMALRNSDYADTTVRHDLLQQVLLGWKQVIQVLIVLSPILANEGRATLEGASFIMSDDMDGTSNEKINALINVLPSNVVGWFKDDLYSNKMSTLLFKHIKNEDNALIKHVLNLLIVMKRPKGWDKYIEKYIIEENKNSYYLCDIYMSLRAEYQYSYASDITLSMLVQLIKMTAAKHELGIKKPNANKIKNISDRILPDRDDY